MSRTRHLQKIGQCWYVRIRVPTELQAKAGRTHLRRALGTRDLNQANRLKWAVLAQMQAHFAGLADGSTGQWGHTRSPSAANQDISYALPAGSSLRINRKTTLDELAEKWITSSTNKTGQFQRRQSFNELISYIGSERHPEFVSDAVAASYVDERILTSPDSHSTRRRKLSALAAFWAWMAERRYIPKGCNPWRGFKIRATAATRNTPKKRPYMDAELVKLFSGQPTYPALREVMVLALYTGARIDELCSLRQGDVRIEGGIALVAITRSKTTAGERTIAVAHAIPFAILKRRKAQGETADAQLFHELRGGGYDNKLSWHVGQAFRYHRNRTGLDGATDFHSLRRTFITRLENLGVDQVRIARYVGHTLPTLAFRLYSGGATTQTQIATGHAITYPEAVEAAIEAFL